MGIKTFGIKTSKEPSAYYLQFMDEIIDFTEITNDIPEFLDIERIIYAIKEFDIDAVHPGYGYLRLSITTPHPPGFHPCCPADTPPCPHHRFPV